MTQHAPDKKPFVDHLVELRNRLFVVFLALGIGSFIGYYFSQQLIDFLLKPLNQSLYYTSPVGGFNFVMQISLFFGILFALPVFIYHFFHFISPALPVHIEKKLFPYTIVASLLMLTGVGCAYYIGLPTALHFLAGFGTGNIHSLITVNDYFSFVTKYLIGFGLLFQLPVVLLIINSITSLRPKTLLSFQRHIIVGAFVAGALLSPAPDPLNMAFMAIPLIFLYYVSVLFIAVINKRKSSYRTADSKKTSQSTLATVFIELFYFFIIVLVSTLFGLALLFSYAAYENVSLRQKMIQKLPIPQGSYDKSGIHMNSTDKNNK